MTAPLVPAGVDLRDFLYTPVEFGRLLSSETWVLSNDAEKVAALTLWGKSWSEVPAGSIPDNDRMLANLSGAGPRWKRVKDMALRGWVRCDDGRLYHPVMCEKALEAWLEKLASRLSSGAGNAKRWGLEFDPTDIEREIADATGMLAALNPASRKLSRKRPSKIPTGIPTGSHQESRRDRKGTEAKGKEELSPPESLSGPTRVARAPTHAREAPPDDRTGTFEGHAAPQPAAPNPVAPLAIALNAAGFRCTPLNPDLVAYYAEGGTAEHLTAIAALPDCDGKPATYVIRFARRELSQPAAVITPSATGSRHDQPGPVSAVVANLRRKYGDGPFDLSGFSDDDPAAVPA